MTSEEKVLYRLRNPFNVENIDFRTAEVDGVDKNDYPDFSDAYISSVCFNNGDELIEEDLERLMEEHPDIVHIVVFESIF